MQVKTIKQIELKEKLKKSDERILDLEEKLIYYKNRCKLEENIIDNDKKKLKHKSDFEHNIDSISWHLKQIIRLIKKKYANTKRKI